MGDTSIVLPPRWTFPNSYSRLLDEIPSLPALRAYVASLEAAWPYVSALVYWDAVQALQDAEWRLACESWQWQQRDLVGPGEIRYMPPGGREALYWGMRRLNAALDFRYQLEGTRSPGKELALRPVGLVTL